MNAMAIGLCVLSPFGKYVRDHSVSLLKTSAFDVGSRDRLTFIRVSASYFQYQASGCHLGRFRFY